MAGRHAKRAWIDQVDRAILDSGRDYAARGLVEDLVNRGDRLEAAVQGSELEPYRVVVELSGGKTRSVQAVRCNCPYDASEWCKHVAAVLVVWTDRPDDARQAPALGDLAARLDAAQLRAIVLRAADVSPDVTAWLESAGEAQAIGTVHRPRVSDVAQPRVAIDQPKLRREIDRALRAVDPMSWRGPDAPDQLEPFILRARACLAGGDAAAALAIGEAVATPLAERYEDYEGECEVAMFFEGEVAPLLVAAVEAVALDAAERAALAERWAAWDRQLERDYGLQPFVKPRAALERKG
ncbi:MAG: hypothetical protein ABI780_07480 [Ardenticatenales bacterium]